ncbi:MAG: hypothetical protein ACKN9B_06555 [Actinomycetes bacterium]
MPNLIIKNISKKSIKELNLMAKELEMSLNQFMKFRIDTLIETYNSLFKIMNRPSKITNTDVSKILKEERKRR